MSSPNVIGAGTGTARPSRGWTKVRYLDVAGLGVIVGDALSSFFATSPMMSFLAIVAGGAGGALLTWAMRRQHPRGG